MKAVTSCSTHKTKKDISLDAMVAVFSWKQDNIAMLINYPLKVNVNYEIKILHIAKLLQDSSCCLGYRVSTATSILQKIYYWKN